MQPKTIPTTDVEITVLGTKRTIKVYQWLTHTEEDEYNNILTGNQEWSIEKGTYKIHLEDIRKSNRYLIDHFLADVTPEEYDNFPPKVRSEIFSIIDKAFIDSKKK